MNVENEEYSAESANLQRVVMLLRDAHVKHQTAFSDDRRTKALLLEAVVAIEYLLGDGK